MYLCKFSQVWAVAMSGDGAYVACGDYDNTVVLRRVDSGATVLCHSFTSSSGPAFVWSLAISFDGARLVAGSWNGEVLMWQRSSLGMTYRLTGSLKRSDRVFAVALAPGLVAVGDRSGCASVFQYNQDNAPLATPEQTENENSDRKLLSPFFPPVKASESGQGLLSNNAIGACVLQVEYPNRVFSVSLSSDGRLFALAGVHKEVKFA